MVRIHALLFALLLSSEAAVAADAKSFISAALTASDEQAQQGDSKSTDLVTVLNITAGYGVGNGFSIGAKYINYGVNSDTSFESSTENLSLPSQGVTISGYGPMLGYFHDPSGVFVQASYLIGPTKVTNVSEGSITNKGGYGYVLDLGKSFEVTKTFGVAIQVSNLHVTYTRQVAFGVTTAPATPWYDDSTRPYLALFYFF